MATPPPKKKSGGEIPNTKANRSAIIDRIENKLGPVGKGHHESHRRAHLSEWLAQKGKKSKS
jgi:hypothetical protein